LKFSSADQVLERLMKAFSGELIEKISDPPAAGGTTADASE
jgi:hypothetical protein